jgi:hypothetical protein
MWEAWRGDSWGSAPPGITEGMGSTLASVAESQAILGTDDSEPR